ncbi:MAG: hypothetical protein Q8R25_03975 [bacterium]|nr:hypothetical protein [bacterium]
MADDPQTTNIADESRGQPPTNGAASGIPADASKAQIAGALVKTELAGNTPVGVPIKAKPVPVPDITSLLVQEDEGQTVGQKVAPMAQVLRAPMAIAAPQAPAPSVVSQGGPAAQPATLSEALAPIIAVPSPSSIPPRAPTPVSPPPLRPLSPLPTPTQPTPETQIGDISTPATPPAPPPLAAHDIPSVLAKPQGPFRDNILGILKSIKLPERFGIRSSGNLPPPPTSPDASQGGSAQSGATPEPVILSETVTPAAKKSVVPPSVSPVAEPRAPDVGLPPHLSGPPAEETALAPLSRTPHADLLIPPIIPSSPPFTSVATPLNTPPRPTEAEPDHSIVTPLRTLKEDLTNVMRERKISLVSAVALEQDKKRDTRQPTPTEIAVRAQRSRRVFAILFTTGILIFLGLAALFGVSTIQNQKTEPASNPNNSTILFAEQSFSFPLQNLSSSDIKRVLAQARGVSNASLGSITRIVPTVPTEDGVGARIATTEEFLRALGVHASNDLMRALGDEFFFGIHTIDTNAPILIIPVTSYEHAFAGMLAWEPAMNTDFAPAFTAVSSFSTGENGLPAQRTFNDVIMRNYDARALRDDQGTVQLYYSFPTPKILVIAENPYSFTEILSRLQVQRRL